MIGQLPTSLDVGGVSYPIETDYRNILVFLVPTRSFHLQKNWKS
jgi:hypothetical protein